MTNTDRSTVSPRKPWAAPVVVRMRSVEAEISARVDQADGGATRSS